MKDKSALTVWAEVDLDVLKNNIKTVRKLMDKNTKIMGVVKFNAYGHGAVTISKVMIENGLDALGVATSEEGVTLRKAGINAPILIMNHLFEADAEETVRHHLTPMVSTIGMADHLDAYACKVHTKTGVHIRVDTGNTNIGVKPEELGALWEHISRKSHLYVNGIFTHFISSYLEDNQMYLEDIEKFEALLGFVKYRTPHDFLIHAFSSPGIFRKSKTDYSMVRTGTGLYGLSSVKHQDKKGLEPIMSLKARIAGIGVKDTQRHISYTGVTAFSKNVRTALIPVGHGHMAHLLHLRNGFVLINGIKAPVLEGVFMGHMLINITEVPEVHIGDEVVLFGRQHDQRITVEEVAEQCGIGVEQCESICLLDKSVPRLYVGEQ